MEKHTWLVTSTHIKIQGLLKVIHSHVHCKCGTISKTVQDGVVTIDR